MKHIKKFNENELSTISFEDAKQWIKENFTTEKVSQMFDEEINSGNWIDHEQMEEEGYESDYDYYIDYGHGEAEDAVMDQIIGELRTNFKLDFDVTGDETNIYDYLRSEYDCL